MTSARTPQATIKESATISLAAASLGAGAGVVALQDVTQMDKYKHMGVASAATVALGMLGFSPALAAGTVFVGSTVGKELVYDHLMGRGNASLFDTSANLAGALAGFAILTLGRMSVSPSGDRNSLLGGPAPQQKNDAILPPPVLSNPIRQIDCDGDSARGCQQLPSFASPDGTDPQ